MGKLKLLIANRPRNRPAMYHRDSDEDFNSTTTEYRDEDAPPNQVCIQSCIRYGDMNTIHFEGLGMYIALDTVIYL